jgi:hypothetical protein
MRKKTIEKLERFVSLIMVSMVGFWFGIAWEANYPESKLSFWMFPLFFVFCFIKIWILHLLKKIELSKDKEE